MVCVNKYIYRLTFKQKENSKKKEQIFVMHHAKKREKKNPYASHIHLKIVVICYEKKIEKNMCEC